MKYEELCNQILKAVGGKDNINSISHCVTRLRFMLKDGTKAAPAEETKKISGVTGCVIKNGQYQVVIGPHVDEVYDDMVKISGVSDGEKPEEGKKGNIFQQLINVLQQCIAPIIGPMAGTAMIKAVLQILVVLGLMSKSSQTYTMMSMISDGLFYFMPFYFAHSAGKVFGTNGYLTMVIAGAMLHPTWSGLVAAGESVALFGLPVKLVTYSSTFMPILLIAWFQSYVERFAKKISPKAVRIFLVPLITVFITSIVGFVVLGPVGFYIGDVLATVVMWVNAHFSWLVVALVAGLWPVLVMTGMHSSLMPIQAVERTTLGYATIITPAGIISNMSQAAATFAVAVRSKDKELKSLASSSAITAVCGVTEPALYGVSLPLKRPLIAAIIGGACGGLYSGLNHVKAWGSGSSNIFSLPIFIGEDNSFVNAIIMIVITMVVSFVISFIFFKEPGEETKKEIGANSADKKKTGSEGTLKKTEIKAPVQGRLLALSEVQDGVFQSGAMGKGIALVPASDTLVSPVDGTVAMLYSAANAVRLKTADGVEVLINIGRDTAKQGGNHFEALVKQGDTVDAGMPLIRFDRAALEAAGCDLTTPVVVTNSDEFLDVIETDQPEAAPGMTILTVIR